MEVPVELFREMQAVAEKAATVSGKLVPILQQIQAALRSAEEDRARVAPLLAELQRRREEDVEAARAAGYEEGLKAAQAKAPVTSAFLAQAAAVISAIPAKPLSLALGAALATLLGKLFHLLELLPAAFPGGGS